MSGGQRSFILLILLAVAAACGRTPLEDQVPSTTPAAKTGPIGNGSIKVTLYNNGIANGTGPVDLLLPDGSKQTQGASPSCVFAHLTQAGTYTARYQTQYSAAPSGVTATLSVLSPTASVGLQVGGASLVFTPVTAQPVGFDFDSTTFNYSFQFSPPAGQAMDVTMDIDPATLAPGWTYFFSPAVMHGTGSGSLTLISAVGCTSTSCTFNARAMAGAQWSLGSAITVTRHWSLDLSATWAQTLTGSGIAEQYMVRAYAIGIPSGSLATLGTSDCTQFGLELATTPSASSQWLLCDPVDLAVNNAAVSVFFHSKLTNQPYNVVLVYLGYSVPIQIAGHP